MFGLSSVLQVTLELICFGRIDNFLYWQIGRFGGWGNYARVRGHLFWDELLLWLSDANITNIQQTKMKVFAANYVPKMSILWYLCLFRSLETFKTIEPDRCI